VVCHGGIIWKLSSFAIVSVCIIRGSPLCTCEGYIVLARV
jgi:hypothetical protein